MRNRPCGKHSTPTCVRAFRPRTPLPRFHIPTNVYSYWDVRLRVKLSVYEPHWNYETWLTETDGDLSWYNWNLKGPFTSVYKVSHEEVYAFDPLLAWSYSSPPQTILKPRPTRVEKDNYLKSQIYVNMLSKMLSPYKLYNKFQTVFSRS